jgi:putative flippase GtrA
MEELSTPEEVAVAEELGAPRPRRRGLLVKFSGVALIGFGVSAVVLHFGLEAGLRPWAARLIALVCAMNVTFLINGKFVFKALTRARFFKQWAAYTLNSSFGNVCNYCTFVALEGSHWPVLGNAYVALLAGSVVAWAINFTGARLLVFGSAGRRIVERCKGLFVSPHARRPVPAPTEPGPSPR